MTEAADITHPETVVAVVSSPVNAIIKPETNPATATQNLRDVSFLDRIRTKLQADDD